MGIKQYKGIFHPTLFSEFFVIRQEIPLIARDYYLQIIPSHGKQVGNPKIEMEKIFI